MFFDIEAERIRGIEVSYYIVCIRKLWLFSRGIGFEETSDYVEIGKIISESYFKREKFKEIGIGSSKIDFITIGDEVVVNEVKKSRKLEEAHIWQTKFYIYVLQNHGINSKLGIIHYPKLYKKIRVEFQEEDKGKIIKSLEKVNEIKLLKKPPEIDKKPYCKGCAYYEFCYA